MHKDPAMHTKTARLLIAAVLLVGGAMASGSAKAEAIRVVTGKLPPFSISATEKGITHELVEEISKRSGVEIEIEYLPWKRAQVVAQETPNTMIFAMTRTEAREPLYSWVVALVDVKEVFVTKGPTINSYDEAKQAGPLVVLANTPRVKGLKKNGVANFSEVSEAALCARMLEGGRVNAWYTFQARAAYVFKSEGLDPNSLVFGSPVKEAQTWLGAHKDFDQAVSAKLAAALEEIKADGTYAAILKKYVN